MICYTAFIMRVAVISVPCVRPTSTGMGSEAVGVRPIIFIYHLLVLTHVFNHVSFVLFILVCSLG